MWGRRTKKSLTSDKTPVLIAPSTALTSVLPSEPPQYSGLPNECFPPQQAVVERGQVCVSFQLLDLREIKKDLDGYTDVPDQYIQAFISVIQIFELAKKETMLLLDTSLEKQRVLAQATQIGGDFHLQ
jgi:hypothetical protein